MTGLDAIVLGAIQGLTEFLPISSSGHLILGHEFLGYDPSGTLAFDIALHLGTLAALMLYFWSDLKRIVRSFFRGDDPNGRRLGWMILVAMIPAAIAGAMFETFFESVRNPWVVVGTLTAVGCLFILTERLQRNGRGDVSSLTFSRSAGIGFAQALALIPGVSRSGITIVAGMFGGLTRAEAARFTFLLSIPTVAGAAAATFIGWKADPLAPGELWHMGLGLLTSAIVGYFVVRFLMRFLGNHSLNVFAYYRFALAALTAILLITR